jgi:hypothetical protein
VWGDLVHVAPIQFPDPAVTVTYDSDRFSADPERTAAFCSGHSDFEVGRRDAGLWRAGLYR